MRILCMRCVWGRGVRVEGGAHLPPVWGGRSACGRLLVDCLPVLTKGSPVRPALEVEPVLPMTEGIVLFRTL